MCKCVGVRVSEGVCVGMGEDVWLGKSVSKSVCRGGG